MNIDYAQRKARGGRGLIPPNPNQWNNEHNGLDVRQALGLDGSSPLPAIEHVFATVLPQVTVLPHGGVPAAAVYIDHFRRGGVRNWSGLGLQLPDGSEMVVYNDSHAPVRIRATLMEEFFHIYLDHPRSTVRVLSTSAGSSRTLDTSVENEAYGSGAAALVPFSGLCSMVGDGTTVTAIASYFQVSKGLVEFRLKVTKLYAKAKSWRKPSA